MTLVVVQPVKAVKTRRAVTTIRSLDFLRRFLLLDDIELFSDLMDYLHLSLCDLSFGLSLLSLLLLLAFPGLQIQHRLLLYLQHHLQCLVLFLHQFYH